MIPNIDKANDVLRYPRNVRSSAIGDISHKLAIWSFQMTGGQRSWPARYTFSREEKILDKAWQQSMCKLTNGYV